MQSMVKMNDALASPLTALCMRASELVSKHGFANKKKSKHRKGVNINGTKLTNAKTKRKQQYSLANNQKEPT
jgi:hypothetical protein